MNGRVPGWTAQQPRQLRRALTTKPQAFHKVIVTNCGENTNRVMTMKTIMLYSVAAATIISIIIYHVIMLWRHDVIMSSCHDGDDDDDDGNDNVSVQSPVPPRFADVSAQLSLSCFCLFTKHSWILGQAKHAVFFPDSYWVVSISLHGGAVPLRSGYIYIETVYQCISASAYLYLISISNI